MGDNFIINNYYHILNRHSCEELHRSRLFQRIIHHLVATKHIRCEYPTEEQVIGRIQEANDHIVGDFLQLGKIQAPQMR